MTSPTLKTRLGLKNAQLAILPLCLLIVFTAPYSESQSPAATLTTNPVFVKDCAKCHGATAEGRHFRGPSLVSEKVRAASEDELRQIITSGKGHMPKFAAKLTPDEISALVQQIKALNQK